MIQTLRTLWRNPGGLHLAENKDISTQSPSRHIPLAAQLVIPLLQHAGEKPKVMAGVSVGAYVYKGQPLAVAQSNNSVNVHASTSGTISAIALRPIAHPSGLHDLCVVLIPDGKDDWGNARLPAYPHYTEIDPAILRQRVKDAGVVGMGGAVFPSAVKLNVRPDKPIRTLILNGAECEPYITCDDMLMREQAAEIVAGAQVMMHMVKPQECLIGVEDNKPVAIAAMQAAVDAAHDSRIQVIAVPTLYPSGGAKQLTFILTGKEVPSGGRSSDIGVVCNNVATARAIYHAVVRGEPSLSRYVTVTGNGIAQPCNLEVPFGTPISHLAAHAGGTTPQAKRWRMGGPMMGITLHDPAVPVVKAMNCLLINDELEQPQLAMPCIRCGRCTEACPTSLLPQQLYWFARAKEFDKAKTHHLADCIECGCCEYVCPSHIPLVSYYRFAKAEIRAERDAKVKADLARERHEFHVERLERAKREKAEKLAKHKEQAQTTTDDSKKAAIQAALERAKAKKAGAAAQTTSEDTPA
ncbi:MAG: electron transport complex subunit RsxC [Thiothrix lacustris]|uniref:Ion-translocating oxidoreductase complex subunit C n=1 Tax=Thiothrix lacustris TaxID=525917 RepID=A0A1Y1QT24_9GAMM|nr:MAG: electron transport complex subunit RsxC [Thiothrix lacustris]